MEHLSSNHPIPFVVALALAGALLIPVAGQAGPPTLSANPGNFVIFPAKGQTPEQQKLDEKAAYEWASQQTGWDPYKAQQALAGQGVSAAEKSQSTRGQAVGGAARGALLGVAIGAIAGDAGEGAAIGAAAGGLTRGMHSRRTRHSAAASFDQASGNYNQMFERWKKNFAAAMEGKGYTVK